MSLFLNENPNLGSGASVNGNAIPDEVHIAVPLTASSVSTAVWICPSGKAYQLVGVDEVHGTASTSGTLTVEKCTGTTAAGSGTALLTGTISLAGTANTVVSGTVLAGDNSALKFGGGDRLTIKIGGTMTSLANAVANIRLKRIQP